MTTIGTTNRRAKPVVKRVKTRAAMAPSSTQVMSETTRVATAKARNRSIGRPARAVWAARKTCLGQHVMEQSRFFRTYSKLGITIGE